MTACGLFLFLVAFPQSDDAEGVFKSLLDAARAQPTTFDATALRQAFANTTGFDPDDTTLPDTDAVDRELANGERAGALIALDRLMAGRWVDVETQAYAARVCKQLRDDARAASHRALMQRLLASILESGDGASAATAFVVINRAEERLVLGILGKRGEPSTARTEGDRALRVYDCEGGERIYFRRLGLAEHSK